jgi:hypothetical protein
LGHGDRGGFGPGEVGQQTAGCLALGGADQEGEAAAGGDQGGGAGEDGFEAFDGAEGDYVEGGAEGFGACALYIDVRQCKSAGDFAQEGGLLVIGLDQSEGDVGSPEFEREAGESGAGAHIGYTGRVHSFHHRGHSGGRGRAGKQVAGGEQALAEVAGDDVFGVADGGQIDAGVPPDEDIDIRRYTLQLCQRQDSRLLTGLRRFAMAIVRARGFARDRGPAREKGLEQLGDAGGVHGIVDCRWQIGGLGKAAKQIGTDPFLETGSLPYPRGGGTP